MRATAAEIHAYPVRPEGFPEPLFHTAQSRREVAGHLLEAPWLVKGSELPGRGGASVHAREEPVELRRSGHEAANPGVGWVEVVRARSTPANRSSWRRRRIIGVVDRWREVGSWWSEGGAVDRRGFRVAVAGPSAPHESGAASRPGRTAGAIVDLVCDHQRGWLLIGVVD